jgi:hypothetical protein
MEKRIIFYPPPSDVIDRFVRSAAFGLGAEYTDPEAMSGFADFVKVTARAHANNLNRKANLGQPEDAVSPD